MRVLQQLHNGGVEVVELDPLQAQEAVDMFGAYETAAGAFLLPVSWNTVSLLVRHNAADLDFVVSELNKRERHLITERSRATAAEAASIAEGSPRRVELHDHLYPYQRAGVAYVLDYAKVSRRAIIGDEMGLGKTRQAISALKTASALPAVVVCPAMLRSNWRREIETLAPSLEVHVGPVEGSRQADVTVISYEGMEQWLGVFSSCDEGMLRGVVLDEVHYLKSPEARRTLAAAAIVRHLSPEGVALGLTGTPIVNRPAEIVAPLKVLGIFHAVFPRGLDDFKRRYCRKSTSQEMLFELNTILRRSCYVRRVKDQVLDELPDLSEQTHLVEIESHALRHYFDARQDVVEYVRRMRGDVAAESTSRAAGLAAQTYMRSQLGTAKVDAIRQWVVDFISTTGRKLIVFAWHRPVQDEIIAQVGAAIGNSKVVSLQARLTTDEVGRAVASFQDDHEVKVIVCSLQAASTGHTLTAASDVLFAELPWTPAMYDQAVARAHRIGQKNVVIAHNLLAADTLDERLHALIQEKRTVTEAVTDGDMEALLLEEVGRG